MQTLWRELRYGLRVLRKNPGFSWVAILILALGIGASTAIFSVIDAVLLRPLPYPHPQQIVRVWEQGADGNRMNLAGPNFEDLRAQNHTLSAFAEFGSWPASVSGGSEPVRLNIAAVSQDFFKALGVEPFRGRGFTPDEHLSHGSPAMIVSYGYWRQFLAGAADLSQVHLSMDGRIYPVIGVMPPGFDFPSNAAAWVPNEYYSLSSSRTAHNFDGLGRVRDAFTVEQARADLDMVARRIRSEYGAKVDLTDAAVVPLAEAMVGQVRPALLTVLGAVVLLFLVACANVAGLLLARTAERRKEFAVRVALGAGRAHLLRQSVSELAVLSLAGGVLGVLAALWMVKILPAILPANLLRQEGITVNTAVLLFALGATVAVALSLGILAAWRASARDLHTALSIGSRSYSGTSTSQRLRRVLVIAQIAATLVILIGAGLLGRSFYLLTSVSPGFQEEHLITAQLSLPGFQEDHAGVVRQIRFLQSAIDRIGAVPGVTSAGLVTNLPVGSGLADGTFLSLNGRRPPASFDEFEQMARNLKDKGTADYCVASEGYFRTTGIPLLRGRLFNDLDGPDSPHVALISQSLARQQWPSQDPIGQVVEFGNMDGNLQPLTIVGIVGDVRAEGLDQPSSPIIYVDYSQRGLGFNTSLTIVLRSAAPAGPIVSAARGIFHDLDRDVPVGFSTFAHELGGWFAERRFLLLLMGWFAAAALALATVGIYGVVAFSVARRTQEIGIRMALGAQRSDVLRLVVGEGARLALVGVVIGVVLSLAVTRLISSLLFETSAVDPFTFVGIAGLLSGVALLASYIPAHRAMRTDPMVALRYE